MPNKLPCLPHHETEPKINPTPSCFYSTFCTSDDKSIVYSSDSFQLAEPRGHILGTVWQR